MSAKIHKISITFMYDDLKCLNLLHVYQSYDIRAEDDGDIVPDGHAFMLYACICCIATTLLF